MIPSEINKLLSNDVFSVCQMLLPSGKSEGGYFVAGSVNGEQGKSLKVYLKGDKLGYYKDFANPDDSGDLIDLWSRSRGITFVEALKEIKKHLGIEDHQFYKKNKKIQKKPAKPKCKKINGESLVSNWYQNTRLISQKTLEAYKIGVDGDKVIFPYLFEDELYMYKTRDMRKEWDCKEGKKVIWSNKEPICRLFGWQAIDGNNRMVCLVEGENDVLACYEQNIPALSVPFGGGGHGKQQQWIENEYDNLDRFDRIYLMMDMDKEGEDARDAIIESLGRHRCFIVELPKKDAGDCQKEGIDILQYIQQAKTIDPEELKNSSEFTKEVWEEFYNQTSESKGLKLPWRSTYQKLRFRNSEVTIWTGFNGAGKSQVLGQIFTDFIHQKSRVCIASMEMKPRKLIKRMIRQVSGYNIPPQDVFEKSDNWLSNGLWLFNIKGTAKADKIFEVFRYARARYGIKQFLIDSLAKCGMGSEDYDAQKNFIERCCDVAEELDAHIHVVAHSKKKEDESKMPEKMDVKGSGDLTNMVDNVVTIWRNKPKEKKIEKLQMRGETIPDELKNESDCILYCSKQRHEDWEGSIVLWFEKNSYQYKENREDKLKEYIA